jgi:hypothetical protein
MPFANNPQAYLNGFISSTRNVFLISSIGTAMYGFSDTFNIVSSINIVRLTSAILYIFAILYGINAIIGMNRYIKELQQSKEILPSYIQLDLWTNYIYLLSGYLLLLVYLFVISIRRFFNI